MQAYDERLT